MMMTVMVMLTTGSVGILLTIQRTTRLGLFIVMKQGEKIVEHRTMIQEILTVMGLIVQVSSLQ